jgi:riboflavin biosynthesis pyrimidine reductase
MTSRPIVGLLIHPACGSSRQPTSTSERRFLAAGLVDEIRIHVVDVLLGAGRRLFGRLPERTELELTELSQTGGVTHLEYRIAR